MNVKFYVDAKWIESLIVLGFIEGVNDYDTLTDEVLRKFLEDKSKESKEVLNLVHDIVAKKLRANM